MSNQSRLRHLEHTGCKKDLSGGRWKRESLILEVEFSEERDTHTEKEIEGVAQEIMSSWVFILNT